jgi:serine/threonine-protein kinase
MPTESEKRAAALAVSRYGADRARVQQVLQAVLQAQANGQAADLLDTLVTHHLLTQAQADEMRLTLEATHLAPAPPPGPRPDQAKTAGKANDAADAWLPTGPGFELRALGEFRILRRLGEGGMGSVYLGYHEGQGRQVAIKVLPDHLASNPAYVDRFYREAKSGALLDHPNIVRGIAVGQDQATGKHYLVLEFVDGPSAHALLGRFGRLSVGDGVHIALDIARALEHAHSRNIVHRDIKPDNILLTQSGVAKLADLGLAKRTDEVSHLTAARQGFGTPYYMPYEQAMNAKYADGRSDIYALGATLYHLLTGEVPFPGANHLEVVEKKSVGVFPPASTLNPEVSGLLDRIINKMLARDPRQRYQTASELIVDLERSNLAKAVPSFVDLDLALKDPLVRARLTSPAEPTRPDLETPAPVEAGDGNGEPNLWYLRYRNREGRWCKTRATTEQIVQRLQEGRLAPTIEVCPQAQGDFHPLATYPEFREAVAAAPRARPIRPARLSSKARGRAREAGAQPTSLALHAGAWLVVAAMGMVAVAVAIYFVLTS